MGQGAVLATAAGVLALTVPKTRRLPFRLLPAPTPDPGHVLS
jgi:hypothetical protein